SWALAIIITEYLRGVTFGTGAAFPAGIRRNRVPGIAVCPLKYYHQDNITDRRRSISGELHESRRHHFLRRHRRRHQGHQEPALRHHPRADRRHPPPRPPPRGAARGPPPTP